MCIFFIFLVISDEVDVIYESFPGWLQPTTSCRYWEELPANAQSYINRIVDILEVPVRWVGVGAERDDVIDLSIIKKPIIL